MFGMCAQCVRFACFNLTTDSLQIFKTAVEIMSQGQENDAIPTEAFLASPNPDLVHAGESLVMLRTARLDSAAAEPLKSALTDKALRGRDRMDTSFHSPSPAHPNENSFLTTS